MTNEELEARFAQIEQDIADIKEAIATLSGVAPVVGQLNSCDCDTKWEQLYNYDLPKFILSGTTLQITCQTEEE